METIWQNGTLWIDFNFWIRAILGEKDHVGRMTLDIRCKQLKEGIPQDSIETIQGVLMRRCEPTIDDLQLRHKLPFDYVTDLLANVLWEQRIDADTIESDAERKNRLVSKDKGRKKHLSDFGITERKVPDLDLDEEQKKVLARLLV